MSNMVQVRSLTIGEGRPKICVPIVAASLEGIRNAVEELKKYPYDLVEWRADHFEKLDDLETVAKVLELLRQELGETPLLFTIRTMAEGGARRIELEQYLNTNAFALRSGKIDLLDVEMFLGDDIIFMLVEEAHQNGVKVIASNHDFEQTPKKEELLTRLCKMQEAEADIAKIAVMPKSERDVLTLLDATLTMKELHQETPVVTMAMGKLGEVTRVTGALFGSAITFGSVGEASAPGQIPADDLKMILKMFE